MSVLLTSRHSSKSRRRPAGCGYFCLTRGGCRSTFWAWTARSIRRPQGAGLGLGLKVNCATHEGSWHPSPQRPPGVIQTTIRGTLLRPVAVESRSPTRYRGRGWRAATSPPGRRDRQGCGQAATRRTPSTHGESSDGRAASGLPEPCSGAAGPQPGGCLASSLDLALPVGRWRPRRSGAPPAPPARRRARSSRARSR